MLEGPILATLLRLAWPSMAVLVMQTIVSVAETYYLGYLGTASLAGAALVFPILGLMAQMSNGGVGGGVSSAVARALGAGRRHDADALLWHAVVLAVMCGVVFMAAALAGGPLLYRALGGTGAALRAVLLYSGTIFASSVPLWIVNLVAAALRGSGNVKLPARVSTVGALITVTLSPLLIFGLGPFRGFGIAGAGAAVGVYYVGATIVLLRATARPGAGLHLRPVRLQARLFRDILCVGLVSAAGTVQSNLSIVLVTAAVGRFGEQALAGYGIASRLDYLLIPIMFGIGTAVLAMTGISVGAGHISRARAVAWTGGALGALLGGVVGLVVALFPDLWLRLFSHDAAVLATGSTYLRLVGPCYWALGLGMELYFACQGAGRPVGPFLAGTLRMVVAAGGGWMMVAWLGTGQPGLFALVGAATLAYGGGNALAMTGRVWHPEAAGRP